MPWVPEMCIRDSIDTVKYKIEHLTGIKVGKVNVSVEDIRV